MKKSVPHSASAEEIRLVSWKSTHATYWKTTRDPMFSALLEKYRENGLASSLPLSPASAETWLRLAGAKPTLREKDGSIDVRAISTDPAHAGGLAEVDFHVQRENWRASEMTLAFTDAVYQLTEEDTSVVNAREVPSDVMPFLELPKESSVANPSTRNVQQFRGTNQTANLDDLEMAVRYELHKIGADLGESIEFSTRPPDGVAVNVREASPEVRDRVTKLLANRDGVLVEYDKDAMSRAQHPVTRIIPQQTAPTARVDGRVAAFFSGTDTQETYARSLLETSSNLLAHLYALRDLASRWPLDEELSPNSKTTLNTMRRDHAGEILRSLTGLKANLEPLMKNFGYSTIQNIPPPGAEPWQQGAASGLESALGIDRMLRSLLTTSDNPVSPEQAFPQIQRDFLSLEKSAQELNRPE